MKTVTLETVRHNNRNRRVVQFSTDPHAVRAFVFGRVPLRDAGQILQAYARAGNDLTGAGISVLSGSF